MSGRYSVIESCSRPSGAYAKTLASFPTEAQARDAYRTVCFQGPGFGIITSKEIALVYSEVLPRVWNVLARRGID